MKTENCIDEPSTSNETFQKAGKRKRIYSWELETEQNLPNKYFKTDPKELENIDEIDIKHEDPLKGRNKVFLIRVILS